MVTQVLTRQQFYEKYPAFAQMAWGSADRQRWLAAHPGAAAQWTAIRDVEQQMNSLYGDNWQKNMSYDLYQRVASDYLDGGFNSAPAPSSPAPQAPGTAGTPTYPGQTPAPSAGQAAPTYDRNAYELLKGTYEQYGLGSLAGKILEFAQQGYSNDTVEILLRETQEFKDRFKALAIRQSKGLNAISIGQYLQLENEYASILQASGLPPGFYDSKDDYVNWIAGDVAPDELRERVVMAQQATMSSDPGIKQQLAAYYGLGDGDLVAYFLDQKRATTLFETRRVFGTAAVGAEAAKQGLTVARERASLFADQGISQAEARTGFANVAAALPDSQRLSSIYDGADVGQTELEDEFLQGNALASQKRAKLVGKEAANFSGSSGVTKGSLGRRKRGQF